MGQTGARGCVCVTPGHLLSWSLVLAAQLCGLRDTVDWVVRSLLLKWGGGFESPYLKLINAVLPLSASVAIPWLDPAYIHLLLPAMSTGGKKVIKITYILVCSLSPKR